MSITLNYFIFSGIVFSLISALYFSLKTIKLI